MKIKHIGNVSNNYVINLDEAEVQTIGILNDITLGIVGLNETIAKEVKIYIHAIGNRIITFDSNWKWLTIKPAILNNGKIGLLKITTKGIRKEDVVVTFNELDTPGSSGYPQVQTYNDLPDATLHPSEIYIVLQATGVFLINRKRKGFYRSNGVSWARLGDVISIFKDDNFEIYDDSDNTKKTKFEVSGVASGNTRNITMADRNVDLNNVLDKESNLLKPYTNGDGFKLYHTDGVQSLRITRNSGNASIDVEGSDSRSLYFNLRRAIFQLGGTSSSQFLNVTDSGDVSIIKIKANNVIDINQSRIENYVKEIFFTGVEYDNSKGYYNVKRIAAGGEIFFTFQSPEDFKSIDELMVVFIPEDTATVNFSMDGYHAAEGRPYDDNSGFGTARLNLSRNTIEVLKVADIMHHLEAGHVCGLRVRHDNITLHYLGVRMRYISQ